MFNVQRDNNIFQFIAGPGGAVIRTAGEFEQYKVVDLEGRFPRKLYDRLKETLTPGSTRYGSTCLRLPRQAVNPFMMVSPIERNSERWVQLFWFEPTGRETTSFEIALRISEVEKLLAYMDEHMTC